MADYRILKLRSGEEIIAVVSGKTPNELILERPMQLRLTTMHDPLTGEVVKENWIMRNWIPNAVENNCSIPQDFVVFCQTPTEESIFQYELQKEKEDTPPPPKRAVSPEGSSLVLEQLFKQLGMDLPEEKDTPDNLSPDALNNLSNFVMMNFTMSKDLFAKLMQEGVFEEEIPFDDFGFDDEHDPNRSPDSEDWGNDWSDWPDDLEDYLK